MSLVARSGYGRPCLGPTSALRSGCARAPRVTSSRARVVSRIPHGHAAIDCATPPRSTLRGFGSHGMSSQWGYALTGWHEDLVALDALVVHRCTGAQSPTRKQEPPASSVNVLASNLSASTTKRGATRALTKRVSFCCVDSRTTSAAGRIRCMHVLVACP